MPYFLNYPEIRIWHIGCASGEEVYSLAILLDELNILSRCNIFATDIDNLNLKKAKAGIFPLQRMQESSSRYYRAGGKGNLSDFYTAFYGNIKFHNILRDRISFINHDVIQDNHFNKFHLILCRNVFIYFNSEFQQNVLKTINGNLYKYGYLGMGSQEQFVNIKYQKLSTVDHNNRIFRKEN